MSNDNDNIHQELSEFLSIEQEIQKSFDNTFFNRDRTLAMITSYKKYKPKVGTFELKSMKKLWEVIAREISNLCKITVSASKCENRWKVLERNYKKFVDNNNKTGRGSKFFEFEKEFDEIYGKKRNIRPTVLLSSSSTIVPTQSSTSAEVSAPHSPQASTSFHIPDLESSSSSRVIEKENAAPSQKRKRSVRSTTPTYKRRNDILLEMKNDLKKYYEEKSAREERKLELERRKLEDRERRTNLLETYFKEKKGGTD